MGHIQPEIPPYNHVPATMKLFIHIFFNFFCHLLLIRSGCKAMIDHQLGFMLSFGIHFRKLDLHSPFLLFLLHCRLCHAFQSYIFQIYIYTCICQKFYLSRNLTRMQLSKKSINQRSKSNKKQSSVSLQKTYMHSSPYRHKEPVTQKSVRTSMNKNRQKLCNTLDAYVLIMQTNAPLRCLQHNSVLSLYCETEQKLLCANCVYRNNAHRAHKIQPIQQSYRMLARDIQRLQRQTQREIEWFNSSQQTMNNIFKSQEQEASQALIALAHQFEEMQIQLRKYYDEIKIKILRTLQQINLSQQKLLLQLGFYKQIYRQNKLPNKDYLATIDEQHLKYYHLIGNTLVNYGKNSKNQLKFHENRIINIRNNQMKKLSKLKDNLKNWISEKEAERPPFLYEEKIKESFPMTPKSPKTQPQSARTKTFSKK